MKASELVIGDIFTIGMDVTKFVVIKKMQMLRFLEVCEVGREKDQANYSSIMFTDVRTFHRITNRFDERVVQTSNIPLNFLEKVRAPSRMPEIHDANEPCAPYYVIWVEGFATPMLAMYLEGKCERTGVEYRLGWYSSYNTKVIGKVLYWLDERKGE